MINVHTYKVFKGNPYNQILFSAIQDKYHLVDSSLDKARQDLGADNQNIFHVHWEEFLLSKCQREADAENIVDKFIREIEAYKEAGGKVVWTIHNVMPHEVKFYYSMRKLRHALSEHSDRILIHSNYLLSLLEAQLSPAVDRSKIHHLPHPAYPPIKLLRRGSSREEEVLIFGFVRRYKGVEAFLEEYVNRNCAYPVRVAGAALTQDYAHHLFLKFGYIRRIGFDLRYHREEELPALFARAACLVIPSKKIYSSGVMMLALSCGLPVVMLDAPHVREALPPSYHSFLFDPGNADSLFDAVEAARSCSLETRRALSRAARTRARRYSPERISGMLRTIYDELLEAAVAPSGASVPTAATPTLEQT